MSANLQETIDAKDAKDAKTVEAFFVNYPFRRYQDRWADVDRKTLGTFHAENFLKEKHQFYLTEREWKETLPNAEKTVQNSLDIIGLSSFKKFSLLSRLMQKDAYLLKDFLVSKDAVNSVSMQKTTPSLDPNTYLLNTNEELMYKQLWHKMFTTMEQQGQKPHFVAARIPAENTAAIHALLQNGFYYVANEAIYMMKLEAAGQIPSVLKDDLAYADKMYLTNPSISFRLASEKDMPALMKLVSKTPFPTRYQCDKHFSPEFVCQIYQETLFQSFQLENHYIALCEIKIERKKKLAGFISFIFNESISEKLERGWASLDYIAINPDYREKGIATLLNAWAVQFLACSGASILQVKTLAQNYPSSALLSRSQFRITANNVLLHRMA